MTNAVTVTYLDECRRPVSALRNAARKLELPEVYAKSYGHLQLDRPILVPDAEIRAFGDDLRGLFELLVAVPWRCFDGDLRRYCAALGMDRRVAELVCRGATGRPPLHARADAYHDGTRFMVLELNVGSELGGCDTAQVNRAYLARPEFARFAERHQLGFVDTLARFARTLRAAAATIGVSEPTIALVESTGGLMGHRHVFDALQEAAADHGIDLLLGEVHEIGERDGKATLRGTPLDVVLRYFAAGELVDDPTGQDALDLLLRADAAGATVLFTPLEGAAFASKGSLAMLHDPAIRATFSPAECELVDRIIPWTRLVGNRDSADRADLLQRCHAERTDLVLKPGVGYGGVGTVVGHEATDEQWRAALAACVGGDHVVQRRVRPAPEPVVDADSCATRGWVANWGVFVDAEGYAGGFVRALQPGDGAVVSYSNPGTRGTCVFTAETTPPTTPES